jgi:hypothetical protein
MREIKKIMVHCSATRPSMDVDAAEIRRWHIDPIKPGGPFDDIGYHFVIKRDGTTERGRDIHIAGAHAKGHNKDSIGICLIGGVKEGGKTSDANFTFDQYQALIKLKESLEVAFGPLEVDGHRSVSAKDCPCFDVKSFFNK